ncbi:PilW family protein [Stenotrophomonas maltophilia]|uniref:PilW family protein n=1 Tax=Stenotrophomonas sp. RAC2 TaxID=3064902 RepID=UPI0018D2A257|nr:PilW family protein [Stenotrophomonas sp. RAC2]MBH1430867.1 PilW family protein [Stenotrophomonas maltophilia]MDV9043035.1 PilW family protein [Stenotrophomonas sp. RAC2]
MNASLSTSARQAGLSLIELMIAMVIGLVLMLGVIQIFIASQSASRLSEGVARAQENGRFALDFLERDIRMAGHLGCVNDQAHVTKGQGEPHYNLGAVSGSGNPLDFSVAVQGYEAPDTGPGTQLEVGKGSLPANLPTAIAKLSPAPMPGSDILVLRFLAPEGVPVLAVNGSVLTVDAARWQRLTEGGVSAPTLFGVSSCDAVDIFKGTTAAGTITATGVSLSRHAPQPAPTMVYRAESLVYYVGQGVSGPGLRRARADASGAYTINEELVEGIENMQLLFGLDTTATIAPGSSPVGNITSVQTASAVTTQADATGAGQWLRVGQVRVGLIARSASPASAGKPTDAAAKLGVLGVTYNQDGVTDGRYRTAYEVTIALRNRLYGN